MIYSYSTQYLTLKFVYIHLPVSYLSIILKNLCLNPDVELGREDEPEGLGSKEVECPALTVTAHHAPGWCDVRSPH